jgi:hypothetical protein
MMDLRQDEIDHLMENIKDGIDLNNDAIYKADMSVATIKRAKTVRALTNRLCFAMITRANDETIKEAGRDLHNEMFGLWCANRRIEKSDYYSIVRKELKKRNLRFISANPPGCKLVRII